MDAPKKASQRFAEFLPDLVDAFKRAHADGHAGMDWYAKRFGCAAAPREDSLLLMWALSGVWDGMRHQIFPQDSGVADGFTSVAAVGRAHFASLDDLAQVITGAAGEILEGALSDEALPGDQIPRAFNIPQIGETPKLEDNPYSSAKTLLRTPASCANYGADQFGQEMAAAQCTLYAVNDVCGGAAAFLDHGPAREAFEKEDPRLPAKFARGVERLAARRLTAAVRATAPGADAPAAGNSEGIRVLGIDMSDPAI